MKALFLFLSLLLTAFYISCAEETKNAAVESAENIEDTADFNTIVNTVADADDGKENIKDVADELTEKTQSLGETIAISKKDVGVAAEKEQEAVDVAAKHTEEVVENPTQNTENVVREADEKPKDIPVAVINSDKVVSVTVENARQSIEGVWNTGTENTKIEIVQNNGEWVGKIKSSDNEEATIGKVILKDLKKQNEKWIGKLFVVKRQRWTDVEIIPGGTKLDLIVSAGLSSKKVQWSKEN